MTHEQLHKDLETLFHQLLTLKIDMDNAIKDGHSFTEVKMIHLQIKELSRLIDLMKAQEKSANGIGN